MASNTISRPLEILAGVQPLTDATALDSRHWRDTLHCRFINGRLQKIGGWTKANFYRNAKVSGVIRSLFSLEIEANPHLIIGTHSNLYDVSAGQLTNITPLVTTSTAAPNSISTQYGTLANNPITTTNMSNIVRVADGDAARFRVGDSVTLSGATATGGITAPNLNGIKVIREIGSGFWTFRASTNATSTATGGGAAVVRSSGLIRVTVANTIVEGERVKLDAISPFTATSATVSAAGTGYSPSNTITVDGGTYSTPAQFTVDTVKAVDGAYAVPQTSGSYVPTNVLTLVGGTGTSASYAVVSTQVVSATVASGGTNGLSGSQVVTGTTGIGTKFSANVTVSAAGVITSVNSITVGGDYTTNPTSLAAEPVTGAGITGATLNISMGVNRLNVNNAGSYSVLPPAPVAVTGGGGTGATINPVYGINTISLLNAGEYSVTPLNAVTVSSLQGGTGGALTVTYTGGALAGITAAQLNSEFITRNNTSTYFDVFTGGVATSSVTASGGALAVFYMQIPIGAINEVALQGYGAGLYGVGLYGTALTSNSGRAYPRIWFSDHFGDELITTPGNASPVYRWNGDRTIAPLAVSGAPTDVNYSFISDNTLVTFGGEGVENRIIASDQGNITQWVSSSLNQVFRDDVEGAGRLTSHISLRGINLIYTEKQTYTFRKIPLEAGVWEVKLLDANIGLIAPMARCTVRNIGFWMSENNFHMYRGGSVEIIPSNNPEVPMCTALKYVFGNLNTSQKSKIFGWYNPKFDEVWFHYPSSSNNEPDSVVRVCLTDFTWSIDKMDRTAAEYPNIGTTYPRLADSSSNIYYHESGNDDDVEPLPWSAKSCFLTIGRNTANLASFIPDSNQSGNILVQIKSRLFPQSTKIMYDKTFSITPDYENMQDQVNGRYWDYTLSGDALNQYFEMGLWQEELSEGSIK